MQRLTIDGALRELLLRVLDPYRPRGQEKARKELRALLDAPGCKECEDVGYHVTMGVQRSCWACKPAAKPQGEPVAFQRKSKIEGSEWHYIHGCDVAEAVSMGFEIRPLYAEQPAPVAVGKVTMNGDMKCIAFVDAEWKTLNVGDVIFTPRKDGYGPIARETSASISLGRREVGNYGSLYDGPEVRRAYTYKHQPGNDKAHRIGVAAQATGIGGDAIDKGLKLLCELERAGLGVFEL